MLAALGVSVFAGSVALADGHGHGGSYAGAHQGGRSFSREGGGGSRSFSAPRGGNFSPGAGSYRSSGSVRGGGSFSSGRNFGGTMRTAPSARSGFNGSFSGFNQPSTGVRIPDATRPGYSPGSHPRPGFNTTRPDLGVSRNFNDRPSFNRGDRPSFTARPDFNRGADRPGGADSFHRPGFTARPGFDHRPGFNDRPGFNHRPGFNNGRGFSRPGFVYRPGFGPHRHWHGGYWNGVFWPRTFYRSSFVTFWPVLPVGCQTFFFGGVPYYYYDSLYYTWSPARYGYVVTDPPPAAVPAEEDESGSAAVEQSDEGSGSAANVYVYPRNGQSEEQTSNDRYECHQWAASQTGYDPTTTTPETQSSPTADDDYRRALIACLDARGYSVK
jgi:hypothetical protein